MNEIRIEVAWYSWCRSYRWMRSEGEACTANGNISRERAQEIIANNPDGQAVEGEVSFDPLSPNWHWAVELEAAELVR